MDCFYHTRCGKKSLSSTVLLLCECLVCVCHDCARKETLICLSLERQRRKVQPDNNEASLAPYDAYFCCPQCAFKVTTKLHSVIQGVDQALEAQERLIRAAMTEVGKSYFKYTTNLLDLQECYALLHLQNDLTQLETDIHHESETTTIAHLRHSIATLALSYYEGYEDPTQFLTFTENRLYHYYITDTKDEYSSRCIACLDAIQPGFSVQLTCACNYQLCRTCVLINVHIRPETYHNGVHCVLCKQPSRGILRNTEYVAACEHALIQSALLYSSKVLTIKDTRTADSERINLLAMIKLYQCVGYEGNLDVLSEKERDSATLPRLRLEVAKLEEFRLNRLGLIDTYAIYCGTKNGRNACSDGTGNNKRDSRGILLSLDNVSETESPAGRFPIGFLHALQVTKNAFFEHYFIPRSTEAGATSTKPYTKHTLDARYSGILAQLQHIRGSGMPSLNLLDSLILLSIWDSERNTTPTTTIPLFYTVDRILRLLAPYVQSKFTEFDVKLIKSEDSSLFMANILKKLSNKATIEKSVQALVNLKLLHRNPKVPTEYSLGRHSYLQLQFDPLFVNDADVEERASMNSNKKIKTVTALPVVQPVVSSHTSSTSASVIRNGISPGTQSIPSASENVVRTVRRARTMAAAEVIIVSNINTSINSSTSTSTKTTSSAASSHAPTTTVTATTQDLPAIALADTNKTSAGLGSNTISSAIIVSATTDSATSSGTVPTPGSTLHNPVSLVTNARVKRAKAPPTAVTLPTSIPTSISTIIPIPEPTPTQEKSIAPGALGHSWKKGRSICTSRKSSFPGKTTSVMPSTISTVIAENVTLNPAATATCSSVSAHNPSAQRAMPFPRCVMGARGYYSVEDQEYVYKGNPGGDVSPEEIASSYKPIKKRQIVEVYNVDSDSGEDNSSDKATQSVQSTSRSGNAGRTGVGRNLLTTTVDLTTTSPTPPNMPDISRSPASMGHASYPRIPCAVATGRSYPAYNSNHYSAATIDLTESTALNLPSAATHCTTTPIVTDDAAASTDEGRAVTTNYADIRSKWTGRTIPVTSGSGSTSQYTAQDLTTHRTGASSSATKKPVKPLLEPQQYLLEMAQGNAPMNLSTALMLLANQVDMLQLQQDQVLMLKNRAERVVATASRDNLTLTIERLGPFIARREAIIAIKAMLSATSDEQELDTNSDCADVDNYRMDGSSSSSSRSSSSSGSSSSSRDNHSNGSGIGSSRIIFNTSVTAATPFEPQLVDGRDKAVTILTLPKNKASDSTNMLTADTLLPLNNTTTPVPLDSITTLPGSFTVIAQSGSSNNTTPVRAVNTATYDETASTYNTVTDSPSNASSTGSNNDVISCRSATSDDTKSTNTLPSTATKGTKAVTIATPAADKDAIISVESQRRFLSNIACTSSNAPAAGNAFSGTAVRLDSSKKRKRKKENRRNVGATLTVDDFAWSDAEDAHPSLFTIDNIVTTEENVTVTTESVIPITTTKRAATSVEKDRLRFNRWFEKNWNPTRQRIAPLKGVLDFTHAEALAYVKKAKLLKQTSQPVWLPAIRHAEEILAAARNERAALALGHLQFVGVTDASPTLPTLRHNSRFNGHGPRLTKRRKYWKKLRADQRCHAYVLRSGQNPDSEMFHSYFSELTVTPTPQRSYKRLCQGKHPVPLPLLPEQSDSDCDEMFATVPIVAKRSEQVEGFDSYFLFRTESHPPPTKCVKQSYRTKCVIRLSLKKVIELLVKGKIALYPDNNASWLLRQRAVEILDSIGIIRLKEELTRYCSKGICKEYLAYRRERSADYGRNITSVGNTSRFAFWSGVMAPQDAYETSVFEDWYSLHGAAAMQLHDKSPSASPSRKKFGKISIVSGEMNMKLAEAVRVVTQLAPTSQCTNPYWWAVVRSAEKRLVSAFGCKCNNTDQRDSNGIDSENNLIVIARTSRGKRNVLTNEYYRRLRRKYCVSTICVSDSSDEEVETQCEEGDESEGCTNVEATSAATTVSAASAASAAASAASVVAVAASAASVVVAAAAASVFPVAAPVGAPVASAVASAAAAAAADAAAAAAVDVLAAAPDRDETSDNEVYADSTNLFWANTGTIPCTNVVLSPAPIVTSVAPSIRPPPPPLHVPEVKEWRTSQPATAHVSALQPPRQHPPAPPLLAVPSPPIYAETQSERMYLFHLDTSSDVATNNNTTHLNDAQQAPVNMQNVLAALQALSERAMADAAAARAERQLLLSDIAFEKDLVGETLAEATNEWNQVRDSFLENRRLMKEHTFAAQVEQSTRSPEILVLDRHIREMEQQGWQKMDEKEQLQKQVEMQDNLLHGALRTQKILKAQVHQYETNRVAYKKKIKQRNTQREAEQAHHNTELAEKNDLIKQLQEELERVKAEINANPNLHQNISKSQALLDAENTNISARLSTLQGKFAEQIDRKVTLEGKLKQTWKEIYLEREAYASNVVEISELQEDRQHLNAYFVWKEEQERAASEQNNREMQDLLDSLKS